MVVSIAFGTIQEGTATFHIAWVDVDGGAQRTHVQAAVGAGDGDGVGADGVITMAS